MILAAGAATHWQIGRLARARLELARAKDNMDRALASMADGFLLCDADDRVVAWNNRYLEMFPWLRTVIGVGVGFGGLVDAGAQAIAADSVEQDAWRETRWAHHRSGHGTFELELQDGSVIHVIERRTPDGGTVSVMRDITLAERELTRAKAAAEAVEPRQVALPGGDEPRDPHAAQRRSRHEQPAAQDRLTDEQRGYARTIRSSGKALLALINDILDLSRVEAERLELVIAEFDPRRLVEDVAASIAPRARDKGLAFGVALPARPAGRAAGRRGAPAPGALQPDRQRRQVHRDGPVSVELARRALDDDRVELVISVHDTGIGIAADALPGLVRALQAGRQRHRPALRRQRPRAWRSAAAWST